MKSPKPANLPYAGTYVKFAFAFHWYSVIGSPIPTLGASGGVYGLLLAFGMYFPQQRIMLLFPPIAMPAWVAVTGYAALELILGVTGTQQGVAHFAHLGGMVGAFVMIQWRRGKPPFPRRRR